MEQAPRNAYVGYEYKQVTVPSELTSLYLDCYEAFGWQEDARTAAPHRVAVATLQLKRDRRIINKMELNRLQRHFEACAREIQDLERSKGSVATIWALVVGLIGTVFMAGATFAATHSPPVWGLCTLLAVPGACGWLCPYFLYCYKYRTRTRKVQPLIEAKHEEIYEICKQAAALL